VCVEIRHHRCLVDDPVLDTDGHHARVDVIGVLGDGRNDRVDVEPFAELGLTHRLLSPQVVRCIDRWSCRGRECLCARTRL